MTRRRYRYRLCIEDKTPYSSGHLFVAYALGFLSCGMAGAIYTLIGVWK